MDITQLFEPVKQIEMSEAMKRRIVCGCLSKRPLPRLSPRKPLVIAAVLLLLLSFTAVGTDRWGYMRDIKNIFGAITGQEYLNATEEIEVRAHLSGNVLTVYAIPLKPDIRPYAFCDTFSIGSYQIVDKDGNILCEGGETESVPLRDGQIDISVALNELTAAPHALVIDHFIGSSKADQPLKIFGLWEIQF